MEKNHEFYRYMYSLKDIRLEILRKKNQLRYWQELSDSITAQLTQVASFGSEISDKVGKCIENIEQIQREILQAITELGERSCKVKDIIDNAGLDATTRDVLDCRFLQGMSVNATCRAMNYSYSMVCYLTDSGLEKALPYWEKTVCNCM